MNNQLRAKLTRRLRARLAGQALANLNPEALTLVLVDVRQLLEVLGATERYRVLKFHCDWVLHPEMSGGMARRLIRKTDEVWLQWIENHRPIPDAFTKSLHERITFYGFEVELSEFLRKNCRANLPPPTLASCQAFELLYAGIVQDAVLVYTDKKRPTKYVNRAQMRMLSMSDHPPMEKGYLGRPGDYLPFYIEWTFMWDKREVFKITSTCPSDALIARERVAQRST